MFEEQGRVGKSSVSVHIWKLKTGKLGIGIKKAQTLCANISLDCLLTNSKYVNICLIEKCVKRLSTVCIFKKPRVALLGCRDSLAGLSIVEEVAPVLQLTGCYESRRCLIIIIYVLLPSCDNLNESSEVLAEVLNLIGTWSSFLHRMNLALHSHPSYGLGRRGVRCILESWCCLMEGQCF